MFVKMVYSLLLGIFLMSFAAIGISTFYPETSYQTPTPCLAPAPVKAPGDSSPIQIDACQKAQQLLQTQRNFYIGVVASLALAAAVVYLLFSFFASRKQQVFENGFLFGSMFSLLYSLVRGLTNGSDMFKFILVSFSLLLVLVIGYIKFATYEKR